MSINNKLSQLKYLLDNDYIYKYNSKSIYDVPKIESVYISMIHQSDKELDFALQDIQVKNIFLFYSLVNKIPITRAASKTLSKNNYNMDIKFSYVQKLLVKKPIFINNLLNFLFLSKNFTEFVKFSDLSDNLNIGKTSMVIKYPLSIIYEVSELNDQFDIPVKDMYFFIKITFDKILTKNEIKNLSYFG
jgi:hypothetical protein